MRILIIGGTGFMGPIVVQSLDAQGHDVTIFHRSRITTSLLPDRVQEILGDRHPLADVADILQKGEPEIVLDMIPNSEQDAQDVMSVFKGVARRVVSISSQDVYRAFGRVNQKESGPIEAPSITEDSPLRENLYPYRREALRDENDPQKWHDYYDKILVERVVMSDPDLPGTILRLPMVYGPGDYQHRMFPFLKRMDDGRPAILMDEAEARWKWTHGYVENVAHAIVLAVTDERAAGHIYNVGEPFTFTMAEWVEKIGEAAEWQGQIARVPQGRLPEPLRWGINAEQHIVVDSTRIRQELGYSERVHIDEAIRRTVAWEREHPPARVDEKEFDYAIEDEFLQSLDN
jgi:nucleoside-diphosphate-sugar epimerase